MVSGRIIFGGKDNPSVLQILGVAYFLWRGKNTFAYSTLTQQFAADNAAASGVRLLFPASLICRPIFVSQQP